MFPRQPWNFRIFDQAPAAFHEWMRQLRPAVTGTVTLDADASTTVTNELCTTSSVIMLMETNAAAASLMAGPRDFTSPRRQDHSLWRRQTPGTPQERKPSHT